ncbi:hypothetical protein HD806DRAFT_525562 [Xylariaceae sp. AK1471]|nr:hypothetical protein HD806DRAFT_525562 [Xylariaceae sp. AK1471]
MTVRGVVRNLSQFASSSSTHRALSNSTFSASRTNYSRSLSSKCTAITDLPNDSKSAHYVEKAGITVCFVNVGSHHPSIIEAIVKGKRGRPTRWPRMITCPPKSLQSTVLVHVEVGTQAPGRVSITQASAMYWFSALQACVHTQSRENSRSPGQNTCTGYRKFLIRRPLCDSIAGTPTIGRALQFANSMPKGLVYVASAREVLAEEIEPYSLQQDKWVSLGPTVLPSDAMQAERPLIITGCSGRNRRNLEPLGALADLIPGIRVHDTGGSDMCFPFSHIASEGSRFSTHCCTKDADMILPLDCDVPWIPSRNPPPKNAKIYHIDSDLLNHWIPLVDYIKSGTLITTILKDAKCTARGAARAEMHKAHLAEIASQACLDDGERLDTHNIGSILKTSLADSATFIIEAVDHIV